MERDNGAAVSVSNIADTPNLLLNKSLSESTIVISAMGAPITRAARRVSLSNAAIASPSAREAIRSASDRFGSFRIVLSAGMNARHLIPLVPQDFAPQMSIPAIMFAPDGD